MAHLGHRAHLDEDAGAQNSDSVTESLDFAQDMRRQQHALSTFLRFVDAESKGLLHERVETNRRFVENK